MPHWESPGICLSLPWRGYGGFFSGGDGCYVSLHPVTQLSVPTVFASADDFCLTQLFLW